MSSLFTELVYIMSQRMEGPINEQLISFELSLSTKLVYIISQRMEGSINEQLIYLINVRFIFKNILKICAHPRI